MPIRVTGMRWKTAAVLATSALAVAGCGGGDDAGGDAAGVAVEAGATLVATVGPGFDIALETQDGEPVASAAPGAYTLEVSDESSIHNFHLTGPGVDEDSGVAEEGALPGRSPSSPGRTSSSATRTRACAGRSRSPGSGREARSRTVPATARAPKEER